LWVHHGINRETVDQTREDHLIEKYILKTATIAEEQELLDWYNNQTSADVVWESVWPDEEEMLKNRLLMNINASTRPKASKLHTRRRVIAIAATIALVLIGIWFTEYPGSDYRIGFVAGAEQINPGKNTATITLANGRKIILNESKGGVIIGGSKIVYSDGTEIDPMLNSTANQSISEMQTISTPRGGTYIIILPDGSKVWLNAASTLKYPQTFSTPQRKVELVGEAYFEISKDKKRPFIVRSAHQDVTVLGTKFNVESYPNETIVKTTLAEGIVKVARDAPGLSEEYLILKPGEQSQLSGQSLLSRNVDAGSVVAWTKGDFVFAEEGLTDIMKKVARWYDVDVEYRDVPMNIRFDAIISRSNNLSGILGIIQSTGKVKFKLEGRKVIVTQ
jgi:transmembrane sensor